MIKISYYTMSENNRKMLIGGITMDFLGFANSDFDFFKKKSSLNKPEYDERKEEVKRHFREFCYQIQKDYHSTTNKTLVLDKDFQGLSKNKNSVLAKCMVDSINYMGLHLVLSQDNITVNLVCPPEDEYSKFEDLKNAIINKKEIFVRFFKENKNMFLILYKRISKKTGDDIWEEEFKFDNNELSLGNYQVLLENIIKLQPYPPENKKNAGLNIRTQFSKSDAVKIGRQLPARVCLEINKFLGLCENLK